MQLKFGVIFIVNLCCVYSANILVVTPCPAKSHFNMFEPLLMELSKRGHKLWVISHFPLKSKIPNYIDIDLSGKIPTFHNNVSLNDLDLFTDYYSSLYNNFVDLFEDVKLSKNVFDQPEVQELLKTNTKFDLVLAELFSSDMFIGFSYKFKAPLISVVSSIPLPWSNDRVGNPENPSYITNFFSLYSNKMNFKQRFVNTAYLLFSKIAYIYYNYYSEIAAKTFFGDDLPPLNDIIYNTSLIFVNSYHAFNGPRPNSPQVIEIGGIHIKPAKKLPQDIEKFINESKHGVVYFSMGSMVKLSTLSEDKQLAFKTVLSRLPQRVLWKWEEDTMPDQPGNVKIAKWLPQRDILAHPNVKLFISHGGLMGTTEAVDSGVPIVGIPLFGDQPANLAAIEAAGVGLQVSFHNISVESIGYAVNTVLNDPRFAENAKRLSEIYRDRPMSALDTAVYWTEYVIRHKGTRHLQSAAVHLAWYQYLLLDVMLVIVSALIALVFILYYISKYAIAILRYFISKRTAKKEKQT